MPISVEKPVEEGEELTAVEKEFGSLEAPHELRPKVSMKHWDPSEIDEAISELVSFHKDDDAAAKALINKLIGRQQPQKSRSKKKKTEEKRVVLEKDSSIQHRTQPQ